MPGEGKILQKFLLERWKKKSLFSSKNNRWRDIFSHSPLTSVRVIPMDMCGVYEWGIWRRRENSPTFAFRLSLCGMALIQTASTTFSLYIPLFCFFARAVKRRGPTFFFLSSLLVSLLEPRVRTCGGRRGHCPPGATFWERHVREKGYFFCSC